MHWLTLRYIPGFQEDLTSWVASFSCDGVLTESVDICRFSPREERRETHQRTISREELDCLKSLLNPLDFDFLKQEVSKSVIDDAEQVQVILEEGGQSKDVTIPFDVWSWRRERGEQVSSQVSAAISFWQFARTLTTYSSR